MGVVAGRGVPGAVVARVGWEAPGALTPGTRTGVVVQLAAATLVPEWVWWWTAGVGKGAGVARTGTGLEAGGNAGLGRAGGEGPRGCPGGSR